MVSLTFRPKLAVFRHFSSCGVSLRKLKIGDFWEKLQAYSLTFWPKLAVFRHFLICGGSSRKLKIGDFWPKKWQAYKPYLLAKIGCFQTLFFIGGGGWRKLKIVNFWQKWQAYSLTFWTKLAVFRYFFSRGGSWRKLKIGDFWWQKW